MHRIGKELLEAVERMPAFPRSVDRIIELTSDINSDPRQLVEVIEHDPVLITKILKLVNSPYFGLAQRITSVNHAIVYIGVNSVKNLALGAATLGVLPRANRAGFDTDAFLLHSLATAIIARGLARKLPIPENEAFDFFLAGLLHDFGKIVFAHFIPDGFREALRKAREERLPLHEAERQVLTADHAEIGALLAGKWRLPQPLTACIRLHHLRDREASLFIDAVVAANQIGKELGIGFGGETLTEPLPDAILVRLGSDTTAVLDSLGDVREETRKALIFIQ